MTIEEKFLKAIQDISEKSPKKEASIGELQRALDKDYSFPCIEYVLGKLEASGRINWRQSETWSTLHCEYVKYDAWAISDEADPT